MSVAVVDPGHPKHTGKLLFISMIITGMIVVGLLVAVIVNEVSANREICERAVVVRDDARAMWLEAFEMFPDSDEADELRVRLDQLLPRLTCPPSANQDQIPREFEP